MSIEVNFTNDIPLPTHSRFKNLTGMVIGRLHIVKYAGYGPSGKGSLRPHQLWLCDCDCGKRIIAIANSLLNGSTKSCGCFLADSSSRRAKTHGYSKTREYRIWKGIVKRCRNTNANTYQYYGGRGIGICDRWIIFENFIADVGWADSPLHTIDRIDNNDNYKPGNVRWATRKEQARNRSSNVIIEFNGVKKIAIEWAEEYGMPVDNLYFRLKKGWSVKDALTHPYRKHRHRRFPKTKQISIREPHESE